MEDYDELNDLIDICIVEKDETNKHSRVRVKEINKFTGTEVDMNEFFFTQYDSEINKIVATGLTNMMENS